MGHESNIEVAEQSHPVGIESMEIPLDPELVRGVPLRFCLHGLGKYWSMTRKADFDLSEKTDHIDHFLSHDWGTSRSLKVMTLLIVFNSCAAAVATSLVVLLLSITASTGLIPPKLWPWLPLPGFLCYVSILLFWQDVRLLCRRPLLAFLDKLCIAQHDLHLKEQGIRGLGSFLRCSRNLNILWSERYFSRLWCCYEVAAYLKEGGFRDGEKSIVLIPVQMASLLLISTIQSCSTFLVQYALLSVFLSPVIWGALSYGLWEPLVADLLEGIEGEQILKLMIYFTYWAITLAFFCLPTFEIFEQKASGDRDRSRRTEGREVNVLGCKEVQELPLEEDYVSEYF
ncbi:unnamed protein product [Durusdinium trenchii]|uniref:Uncharacterized protein n=1 Tax=Durusdinium trenchii TaxID=1381693 RepID=A0ABP0KP37_9DINO